MTTKKITLDMIFDRLFEKFKDKYLVPTKHNIEDDGHQLHSISEYTLSNNDLRVEIKTIDEIESYTLYKKDEELLTGFHYTSEKFHDYDEIGRRFSDLLKRINNYHDAQKNYKLETIYKKIGE